MRNIIRRSNSPISCSAFPLIKQLPNGKRKIRTVVNYVPLNNITLNDKYSFPTKNEIMSKLYNHTLFSCLDISKGFYHMEIHPDDIWKTAFYTPFGKYEYLRVLYGLKNAPSAWQSQMDQMDQMVEQLPNTQAYMDDILISNGINDLLSNNPKAIEIINSNSNYSQNPISNYKLNHLTLRNCNDSIELHYLYLRQVLLQIKKYNLKINFEKCKLFKQEILFIGSKISKHGILPDPTPLSKALNIKPPNTKRRVQELLGLFNYFHQYIPRYSEISRPITQLLKESKIKWTDECNIALKKLKLLLNTCSPLKFPDFNKPFIIESDASETAIGAILSQLQDDGSYGIIACMSKTFPESQLNWHVSDKEMYSIIIALEKFASLLIGSQVTIINDHKNIKFLLNNSNQSGRWFRWSVRLSVF